MASLSSLLYSVAVFLLFISTKKVASNHVLSVESLLPKEVCSASKDVPHSGLKLVERHGPCSPNVHKPPSTRLQVLNQDQLRANWLQSITKSSTSTTRTQSDASPVPVKSGIPLNSGNYVLTLGIGTPSIQQTVVLDTGSSITWVQCQPCEGSCYPQREHMFDPRKSSTYRNISCTSAYCSADAVPHSCLGSTFVYVVRYGEGTFTVGYYASETLTLSSADVLQNFRFGCGEYNKIFGYQQIAGILGLGPQSASLVSQTTSRYGGVFHYCIPPTQSTTGYVAFGSGSLPANVQYTPMLTHNSLTAYYFLELISISVAGTKLSIDPALFSNAGVLIDSGTVITRLPPTAYSALRSAFQSKMTQYPKSPAAGILDTCYDLSKYANVTLPPVELQFRGVSFELDRSGIMYAVSSSQACLAFAANRADTDLAIFGNTNQRRYSVVYDIPNLRIGFAPNGC